MSFIEFHKWVLSKFLDKVSDPFIVDIVIRLTSFRRVVMITLPFLKKIIDIVYGPLKTHFKFNTWLSEKGVCMKISKSSGRI